MRATYSTWILRCYLPGSVNFNKLTRIFIYIYTALRISLLLSSFLILVLPVGAVNWSQCLNDIRNGTWTFGGRNNQGRPVPLNASTTAISYRLCTEVCGTGPEPFQWSVFSQQFSSWLLPWLALVSQFPFGANDKPENFTAILLTVGSPTLAAYSLVLTVLNGTMGGETIDFMRIPQCQQCRTYSRQSSTVSPQSGFGGNVARIAHCSPRK